MKKTILISGVIVLLGLCLPAAAADVDGTWESEQPGRQGQGTVKTTYEFQSNGSELTGKIISQRGDTPTESPISEGKIDGDNISFTVVRAGRGGGGEIKITYKGQVSGDEITFTREFDFGSMGGPPGGMGGPPGGGPGGGMGGPPGGGGAPPPIVAKRVK